MQNPKKIFLKLPEIQGGKEAFKKYIKKHLIYPKEALAKGVEGIVYLTAEINDNGEIERTWIEKGIGAGCDEEAMRLIGNIHFTKVKNRGRRVKIKRKFRIEFKLPPQKTVNYQVTNKKQENEPNSSGKTYSYTISVK